MQRHRAGLSLARSHRQQPVLPRHLRKVLLFVRWHQPRLVREDPDLIVSGRVALLVLLHMSLSWFFSICRVPVPAEMRCTSPAWIVVHSPASSVMVSCPNSMIVTISSSSWRCIPKPSLDWIKSSLKARSMPRRTLSGTYHSPYEKSQKACIHDRSTKWRSCATMRVTISDPLMTTVKNLQDSCCPTLMSKTGIRLMPLSVSGIDETRPRVKQVATMHTTVEWTVSGRSGNLLLSPAGELVAQPHQALTHCLGADKCERNDAVGRRQVWRAEHGALRRPTHQRGMHKDADLIDEPRAEEHAVQDTARVHAHSLDAVAFVQLFQCGSHVDLLVSGNNAVDPHLGQVLQILVRRPV